MVSIFHFYIDLHFFDDLYTGREELQKHCVLHIPHLLDAFDEQNMFLSNQLTIFMKKLVGEIKMFHGALAPWILAGHGRPQIRTGPRPHGHTAVSVGHKFA